MIIIIITTTTIIALKSTVPDIYNFPTEPRTALFNA